MSDDTAVTIPPHSIEAEQSVLGAMLLDRRAAVYGADTMNPGDFYRDAHSALFTVIRDLVRAGTSVDLTTASDALVRAGCYDRVGGSEYLVAVSSAVPTSWNIGHYVSIVKDAAVARRVMAAGARIAAIGCECAGSIDEVVADAQAALNAAIGTMRCDQTWYRVGENWESRWNHWDDIQSGKREPAISTGFAGLDKVLMGLQRGEHWIISARPSMGKSALACNIAANVAIRGKQPVAFFSLEMNAGQLHDNLMASFTGIDSRRFRGKLPRFSPDEWALIDRISREVFAGSLLHIDATGGMTLEAIRVKARGLAEKLGGLAAVFVDYLQLMGGRKSGENDLEFVTRTCPGLKNLAKELDTTVIALSQHTRGNGENGRPTISGCFGGTPIEANADVILLPYRPSYQDANSQGSDRRTADSDPLAPEDGEIIIGKARTAPACYVDAWFTPGCVLWSDPRPEETPPPPRRELGD